MNKSLLVNHRWSNLLNSLLLLLGMVLLLLTLGFLLAGTNGALLSVGLGLIFLLLSPVLTPSMVFRLYGARPLNNYELPELHQLLKALAVRAGLPRVPRLYYLPTSVANAFSVGHRDQAAVGITDGLLRRLDLRELTGVLAHEISHVLHNDLWVMSLADLISRLTSTLSWIGLLLVVLNFPLLLMGYVHFSWVALLLLLAGPTLSAMMQMALSRTREFDADLGAVTLTGDPLSLASALQKISHHRGGLLQRILLPGRKETEPSILRTHPNTAERVRRLMQLQERPRSPLPPPLGVDDPLVLPEDIPAIQRQPHWRISGLWY